LQHPNVGDIEWDGNQWRLWHERSLTIGARPDPILHYPSLECNPYI
jgi:hypothetical protein